MPPLSTQEQDDQQGNDETENGSTFGQSSTQQKVGLDLAGSFRLAADGLRCLTGRDADAEAAANTIQRCDASAQSYESVHNFYLLCNIDSPSASRSVPLKEEPDARTFCSAELGRSAFLLTLRPQGSPS